MTKATGSLCLNVFNDLCPNSGRKPGRFQRPREQSRRKPRFLVVPTQDAPGRATRQADRVEIGRSRVKGTNLTGARRAVDAPRHLGEPVTRGGIPSAVHFGNAGADRADGPAPAADGAMREHSRPSCRATARVLPENPIESALLPSHRGWEDREAMLRSFGKGRSVRDLGTPMFRLRCARDTLNGVAAQRSRRLRRAQLGRRALRRRLKGGTL